jgi:hypothetical protein
MLWSQGEDLEDLVQLTTMLEGDIVNNLRRALNLLQQLRIIAIKLSLTHNIPFDEAINSLKRSHVISQLDEDSDKDLMPFIPESKSLEEVKILATNNILTYNEEENGISSPILREPSRRDYSQNFKKNNKKYPFEFLFLALI